MEQYDGAVPQGVAVDWPNYPKRGFMLDVGRKFVPIWLFEGLCEDNVLL